MRNIHEVENIKDIIRSDYNINADDFIEDEKTLMKMYQFEHISEEEFENELNALYRNYVEETRDLEEIEVEWND